MPEKTGHGGGPHPSPFPARERGSEKSFSRLRDNRRLGGFSAWLVVSPAGAARPGAGLHADTLGVTMITRNNREDTMMNEHKIMWRYGGKLLAVALGIALVAAPPSRAAE